MLIIYDLINHLERSDENRIIFESSKLPLISDRMNGEKQGFC